MSEGVITAMGGCFCCKRVFTFNPRKVPSFTPPGREYRAREPICRTCIDGINVERKKRGLPEFEIQPDAYEPLPEGEL